MSLLRRLQLRLRDRERHDGAAKPLRGAFMILHTPFTSDGMVDWDDLAREARFVDRCGCEGVVWPQGSSRVATLTRDERLRGMATLAEAMKGARAALVLGVQGRDTDEMLEYAARAEALAPDAMIAMPPSSGRSMDDYGDYFRALAKATRRPVIMQTSGGNRDLALSTDLIVALAREFPHFGYVKEESAPDEQIPGANLYLFKKRGIFKTAVTLLPDGRRFLFTAKLWTQTSEASEQGIYLGSLEDRKVRRLLPDLSSAVYSGPGHILFARDGQRSAVSFDLETGTVTGEPFSLGGSVARDPMYYIAGLSASSAAARIAVRPSPAPTLAER